MHALPPRNGCEHTPCSWKHKQAHVCITSQQALWACAWCTRTHRTSTRMYRLAAITLTMRLVHEHTEQTHACIASQQSQWACALHKPKHTLPHMHASPRSNHSEHAPCTSPNTHSHTRMHRLAVIHMFMHAHIHMHASACKSKSEHTVCFTHIHASPRTNDCARTLYSCAKHTHIHKQQMKQTQAS